MSVHAIGCFLLALAPLAAFAGEAGAGADAIPVVVAVPERGEVRFERTPLEPRVPERFRLDGHTFAFETEFARTSGPIRIYKVRFPSPVRTAIEANNTVHGEYYIPEGEGPFPGCVVLHILGGEFPLSQMVANSLARKRVAALFIKMPYYGERRANGSPRRMISRDPEETVEGMTQAVLDIRRAAAWLAARPEVDPSKLGVTGISLGGIMSALSAAAEPRFRKVAIYLGGGKLAEALWELEHEDAAEFRRRWRDAGGTRDSFLETVAPVDPATYAHLLKDRDVLMVAARHDEIIPAKCTLALWNAIGTQPELVWLDAGHISAALYLYGEMERLGRFFAPTEAGGHRALQEEGASGTSPAGRAGTLVRPRSP
ncbi:MAG TPA: alpha/beta hydrolase family protein [Planctomycetaceae bacterium]|nr:alpha/beta hydrolase family protein [Planctomycetaceae bacterium]